MKWVVSPVVWCLAAHLFSGFCRELGARVLSVRQTAVVGLFRWLPYRASRMVLAFTMVVMEGGDTDTK